MSEQLSDANPIESMIHQARMHKDSLMINPDYLDDERLPGEERSRILKEIYSKDVRQNEIKALANHFAPLLDKRPVNHALIYGPTGSGKTATVLHFLSSLKQIAQQEQSELHWYYVELTAQSTCFAALNRIAYALEASRIYHKGIPIELMQGKINEALCQLSGTCVIHLDEVDCVNTGRDILLTYLVKTLPRIAPVRLIYIFTTNRLDWDKSLDARTLSCMRKQDIIFRSYDAMEITQILNLRIQKALNPDRVDKAAVSRISAISSRDSGDARKAVELLGKAVTIASRNGTRLSTSDVEEAESTLEEEKVLALSKSLPLHQKLCLMTCYTMTLKQQKRVHSGEVYDAYCLLANNLKYRPISQRRFSDILSALDLYGVIDCRMVSRGRFGKTREINPVNEEISRKTIDYLKTTFQ